MAEPTIEMDTRAYNESSGTYNVAIIDGGSVQSGSLRFSSDGVSGTVEIPTSGNKWAEELWWDSTADTLVQDSSSTPDQSSLLEAFIKVTSDAVSFDTAPKFTIYDSASHTEAEEVCVGTTNHTSPLIKGRIATAYTAPSQYWGEASDAALHAKETAGAVTPTGNNGLCGATNYLQASSTNINTTPQYIWLAFSVPYDATTGVDAVDCVFSMTYTYT